MAVDGPIDGAETGVKGRNSTSRIPAQYRVLRSRGADADADATADPRLAWNDFLLEEFWRAASRDAILGRYCVNEWMGALWRALRMVPLQATEFSSGAEAGGEFG